MRGTLEILAALAVLCLLAALMRGWWYNTIDQQYLYLEGDPSEFSKYSYFIGAYVPERNHLALQDCADTKITGLYLQYSARIHYHFFLFPDTLVQKDHRIRMDMRFSSSCLADKGYALTEDPSGQVVTREWIDRDKMIKHCSHDLSFYGDFFSLYLVKVEEYGGITSDRLDEIAFYKEGKGR